VAGRVAVRRSGLVNRKGFTIFVEIQSVLLIKITKCAPRSFSEVGLSVLVCRKTVFALKSVCGNEHLTVVTAASFSIFKDEFFTPA